MGALGRELIDHADEITQRWYEAWRRAEHTHPDLAPAALKNSLAAQLEVVGAALLEAQNGRESAEGLWKVSTRLDPEQRVAQEFPIEQVVQEYALVLQVVRDWIEERRVDVDVESASYFYQAMFELAAESVRRYVARQADLVMKQRAEYLAGIMHQMRTPLAVLLMDSQRLARGPAEADPRALERIGRSARRLSHLVNGVMRLERFKASELPVHPVRVRPAQLIDLVVDDVEPDAARKGLRLVVEVDRTLEQALDPDLFVDALGNLLHNAVKFTRTGWVRVSMAEHTGGITFSVQDTGPGMSVERQAELFRPVEPAKAGGAGIGTMIAQRAVAAQGGEIGVESTPGEGSRFWFRLPREVVARAPAGRADEGAAPG